MLSYFLRRCLSAIPTMLIVIGLCFTMLRLAPGGPFDSERQVSPEVMANIEAKYHLNEPPVTQFFIYLKNLMHGDLGASFRYVDWDVNSLVAAALPVSATIGGLAILFALVFGVALGIFAALRQNSFVDYFVMLLGNLGSAIPSFVLGPVAILVFAIWLPWLPAGGWGSGAPLYLLLPVGLLTIINVATLGRVMRGSLIEVMGSPFIRTAKAKGLPMHTIILRHALKPALLPVVSILGPLTISSITQAVVTESVFALPGLGTLLVNGAINRDYTLVMGLVVLVALVTVILNLLVDLAYAWIDPKIRY